MKILKDKQGNKLTFKEFMTRWKDGIEGITPLQKLKTQVTATRIQLLGIVLGMVASLIAYESMWWIAIILLGALINTVVQYLGLTQQRDNLIKHEENCEEMSLDDLMGEDEDCIMAVDGKEASDMSASVINIGDFLNKQEMVNVKNN